jgi:hypothetical protein
MQIDSLSLLGRLYYQPILAIAVIAAIFLSGRRPHSRL